MTEEEIEEEQKVYEAQVAKHWKRVEAWAQALYLAAQLKGLSHVTYEQVLDYVYENSSDDYECEPSPREWARIQSISHGRNDQRI